MRTSRARLTHCSAFSSLCLELVLLAGKAFSIRMPTDTHVPQPPATAEEFCSRGMDKLRTGNFKDAIDDFTQAIKLRPDVAAGYRYRAIAHAESGNVTRAIADLD